MAEQDVVAEAEVVRDFLGALERFDIDAAVELLAPEIVYQNVPFPPARGVPAVERQLRGLARWGSGFEVRYDNVATHGPTVLTERTDIISLGPVDAAFWVCGTFEVHDGRITLWRDRFDFVNLAWAFIRGAFQALLGRRVRRPAA
ncbi:MAG: limonene-1,2-epoxide hydrolase family protein [Acidimicrobiia bacterium]